MRLDNVRLEGSSLFGEPITFVLFIHANASVNDLRIGSSVWNEVNKCIGTLITEETFSVTAGEQISLRLLIPNLNLSPGKYYSGFSILQGGYGGSGHRFFDMVIGTPRFQIMPNPRTNNLIVANWQPRWGSVVFSNSKLIVGESKCVAKFALSFFSARVARMQRTLEILGLGLIKRASAGFMNRFDV